MYIKDVCNQEEPLAIDVDQSKTSPWAWEAIASQRERAWKLAMTHHLLMQGPARSRVKAAVRQSKRRKEAKASEFHKMPSTFV